MTYVSAESRPTSLSDRYLLLLCGLLLGYALVGKGFAYLGAPPLFVGEIAIVIGFFVLLRTGCLIAMHASIPSVLLATTMAWVLLRTLPFIGAYGFDALRDSVVIMYGGFAFIIIAVLLEDPRRIDKLIRYYGLFLSIYVPTIPFLLAFSRYIPDYIPQWPGYNVPVLLVQPTEVAVHLTGAAVFALVGFRKFSLLAVIGALIALAMIVTSSRGGTLAFVVPVVLAAVVIGKLRELLFALTVAILILLAALTLETSGDHESAESGTRREVSAAQVLANLKSIAGYSQERLEGTKTWRLDWWNAIVRHTIYGPYFWGGRGFGLNLADADNFQHRGDPKSPPLRSPHNVHMTILARAGVPGAVLWLVFLVSWVAMITSAMRAAHRCGHAEWAGLFLWIFCYVLSGVINASFDVALEGPVQGIWFWCLIGFAMGTTMIYRCQNRPSQDQALRAG